MIPHLIHPIPVDIQRLDLATTVFDDDAREPIQQASRMATVTLYGQPRWRRVDDVSMHLGGDRREARGYILFRKEDMDAAGFTVAINDKFIRIGSQVVEYFVIEREWIAHLQRHNGPSLLKAWFSDRRPSKQSGI